MNLGNNKALVLDYRKYLCDLGKSDSFSLQPLQSILDILYAHWDEEKGCTYLEFLELIQDKYGKFAKFLVLAQNYNYQVENGGHMQYFDNGYASEGSGVFSDHDPEIPLHKEFLNLFETFGFNQTEIGKKVFDISSKFAVKICFDEDEQRDFVEVENHNLDDDYYKVNNEWVNFLNDMVSEEVAKFW